MHTAPSEKEMAIAVMDSLPDDVSLSEISNQLLTVASGMTMIVYLEQSKLITETQAHKSMKAFLSRWGIMMDEGELGLS
jgi:hypothetical protein